MKPIEERADDETMTHAPGLAWGIKRRDDRPAWYFWATRGEWTSAIDSTEHPSPAAAWAAADKLVQFWIDNPIEGRDDGATMTHGPYITWGLKRGRGKRARWGYWAKLDVPKRIKSKVTGSIQWACQADAWAAADSDAYYWIRVYEQELADG